MRDGVRNLRLRDCGGRGQGAIVCPCNWGNCEDSDSYGYDAREQHTHDFHRRPKALCPRDKCQPHRVAVATRFDRLTFSTRC